MSGSSEAGRLIPAESTPFAAFGLQAALSLVWSFSFLFVKITVATIPPATAAAARLALAAIVLWLILAPHGPHARMTRRDWRNCMAMGFFSSAAPFWLISWGQTRIDSGLAGILMALVPLVTAALSAVFLPGKRPGPRLLVALAIGFLGSTVSIVPNAALGAGELWGAGALALAATCYGAAYVVAPSLAHLPSSLLARNAVACAALQIIPVSLLLEQPWTLTPSLPSLAGLIASALLATALGYLIYFRLIAVAGPIVASFNNYIVPALAALWGALLLDEHLSWMAFAGLAVTLFGVALAGLEPKRR